MTYFKKIAYYPVVWCISMIALCLTIGILFIALLYDIFKCFYGVFVMVLQDSKPVFYGIFIALCGGEFYKYPVNTNRTASYKETFRGALDNDFI